jgi:hypothetical protein
VIGFVAADQQTTAKMLTTRFCSWCHDHLLNLQVARVPGVSG